MASTPRDLFAKLASPFTGEDLFDCLTDVVYFIKNQRAEYMVVNRALVERLGVESKAAILGRTAQEVFPEPLGKAYREQDVQLLQSGSAVVDQLELHLYPTGRTGWCLTNKFPLHGVEGKVIGLAGLSYDLHEPDESADGYKSVAEAIQFARSNLDGRLLLDDLASVAKLSAYQLDRRIRRLFRLTTGQLLHKFRMDEAARRLTDSQESILSIALTCGYNDPSAFARQFRLTTGLSPIRFRQRAQKV